MADLSTIITKFEGYKDAIAGLESFVFSDLSDINKHDKKNYKLLFLTPPSSTLPDVRQPEYEHYALTFYIFDTFKGPQKRQGKTLPIIWSECGKIAKQVVKKMLEETNNPSNPAEYVLDGVPAIDRGHEMHNSNLVGVEVNAVWRLHECL